MNKTPGAKEILSISKLARGEVCRVTAVVTNEEGNKGE